MRGFGRCGEMRGSPGASGAMAVPTAVNSTIGAAAENVDMRPCTVCGRCASSLTVMPTMPVGASGCPGGHAAKRSCCKRAIAVSRASKNAPVYSPISAFCPRYRCTPWGSSWYTQVPLATVTGR